MNKKLLKLLKQGSTWRGLALLGSGIALATGDVHLFNATIDSSGLHMGGLIGDALTALTPILIGVYETVKDDDKNA
ncbi:hypothetical protein C5F63_06065 [Photobacterium damselae subsp. damselae]|uniref:hypothetical protein n=1 Tax=Photobacterium damselae TaxID=38293 RepID=UPI000D067724|nr:hypothetical protein [Photobacterium damselae]PSB89072.1 hypothetical protein C5F63_06065 [Photobacterium damselae subsp. damselae]